MLGRLTRRYGALGVLCVGSGFMGWATSSVNRNLEVRDAMNREPITEEQMAQMKAYVERGAEDRPSLREVLAGVPPPKGGASPEEYVPWKTPPEGRTERTWAEFFQGVPQAQVELRAARERQEAASEAAVAGADK